MTPARATLRDAVAALASVQASFVVDDRDDGWRLRLVQRRRLLQIRIADIAVAWRAIEHEDGEQPAGKPFRSALLQLRARVAEHQAAWPAVSIDLTDPRFIESRNAIRTSSADFHTAAAALLPASGRPEDRKPLP